MWFKAFISVCLAVLAHGCSSAYPAEFPEPRKPLLTFHGEKSFSKEDRAYIEKAFSIWEKQTAGQAVAHIEWDYDQTKVAGDWNIITKRTGEDEFVKMADCAFSEDMGLPEGECVPAILAWVGPEDAGGIGMHNIEGEPVTLNLIPERYESEERWVSVVLHEIGHVYGVAHNTKDRQAVMWPSNDPRKVCLRQPDLVAFCSVNVCDGRKMFPCE